jgi:hypothetical protein
MADIITDPIVTPEGLAIETVDVRTRSYSIELVDGDGKPRSAIYGWKPINGWTFDLLRRYTQVLDDIRAIESEGFVFSWERPLSEVRE